MSDLAQKNTPELFPELSVVIPVYNEEECLETLFTRLTQVMDSLNKTYEIILINDGSRDRSSLILHELYQKRPENMVILEFNRNYGQHMAIMAGFEKSRGEVVVTMDADLQNLPEDIPLLLAKIDEGHDVVGGIRTNRQDKLWRITVSKLHNWLREKLTKINMVDEGCMLRAYKKSIVKAMVESDERSTFIPALAVTYASNPTDIKVRHAERLAGETGYNLYKLIRYNFDFFANFSRAPLEAFTLIGVTISLLSVLLFIYLMIRRMIHGPDVEGMFTLFAIQFFLTGILLMGLGIVGEYVGRIYEEVRQRPRYIIKTYLSATPIDQESKVKFSAPARKKTSKINTASTATKKIEKKSENLNKNKKQENKSANQSKGE
jgi:undecaprenyl-phosphate 4-deoxy-4-formamido-L-arabinose transferase